MKRIITILATFVLVLAVSAPIASAAKSPARASHKASHKKQSLRPCKKELVRGYSLHIAKRMSAQNA